MDNTEFRRLRKKLERTQSQMAQLLGVSLKAIHSYEQGWRSVPVAVERQMYFLVSRQNLNPDNHNPCWAVKNCPEDRMTACPAWEFKSGDLCWFINGTHCDGCVQKNWKDKMTQLVGKNRLTNGLRR